MFTSGQLTATEWLAIATLSYQVHQPQPLRVDANFRLRPAKDLQSTKYTQKRNLFIFYYMWEGEVTSYLQLWPPAGRHGVIVIDYCFLRNRSRNRLNWPKMNCNPRILSRLNLEIFNLLHCCAMNRGCDGGIFSFIIVCYNYVSVEAVCPSVWVKSRQSRGKQSACSYSRFVPANLSVDFQK